MARRGRAYRGPIVAACRTAMWLVLMVAASIVFLEEKVQLDEMARQIDQADRHSGRLREERSQLLGLIVFGQKPGTIERIARGRLAMGYPAGRLDELTYDALAEDLPE